MCAECWHNPCLPRCPNYDPNNDPSLEIVAHCPICDEPIFTGDEIYKLPDGTMYHCECFEEEYKAEA